MADPPTIYHAIDTPSTDFESEEDDAWEDEGYASPVQASRTTKTSRPSGGLASRPSSELIKSPRVPWRRPISVCLVDPFGTLPIEVDGITNQLLYFYGQNSYWETAYALSETIKPSIKGSWEYQAGVSVSHFHILMARSALHQLRVNKHTTPATRKRLEYAALKHQDEALTLLREKVDLGPEADPKEILTSVISIATFEQRYGDRERAHLHFRAARDMIKQVGGFQDGLHDRLREEQALWFEGIYNDPAASFVWGKEDASTRCRWLKSLLGEVDRIWRDRLLLPPKFKAPFLAQDGRLHEFLSRKTQGRFISVYSDIDEAVAQQRCLLIFVCIIAALHAQLEGKSLVRQSQRVLSITMAVRGYADWIEERLVEHNLGESHATADMLWIMLQNYHEFKPRVTSAAAMDALRRLDMRDCHWRACGIANVAKYLPDNRGLELRNSLLAFIRGDKYTGKMNFNEFDFSYADG